MAGGLASLRLVQQRTEDSRSGPGSWRSSMSKPRMLLKAPPVDCEDSGRPTITQGGEAGRLFALFLVRVSGRAPMS
jgi:hypothetical protein